MGFFDWFKRTEERAEVVGFGDPLLEALLGGNGTISRETALQIPTVSGGIDLIANVVAGTPIKLYRDTGGKAKEVKADYRLKLLNDETGDTLNANEFWRAMIRDYYLGKGAYAYINRSRGKIKSLHYVDEKHVSIVKNADPIFKDFDIHVDGAKYKPYDFMKVLRNTRDGATGEPITVENSRVIEVAYQDIILEFAMAKRGGNKKGFLQAEKKITEEEMKLLRERFRNLYRNDSENMMVLNAGLKFQECSDTSAEMQLDENKRTNAAEFAKIFHVSPEAISGGAVNLSALAKLAAIPLMQTIQCALNRDMLLEREKGEYYFAFDTKELMKGEMQERFAAYKTALDANFMQIDEVRYAEDLEPLGLNWIKLGLQDVLYDPKSNTVYTPNTNQTSMIGENTGPEPVQERADCDIIELRMNENHDEKGRFAPGGNSDSSEGAGKAEKQETKGKSLLKKKNLKEYMKPQENKYARSERKDKSGLTLEPHEYNDVCSAVMKKFGVLNPSDKSVTVWTSTHKYRATGLGDGRVICRSKKKL